MKPLFIRADASTQIGTGHVMRCLALAQAWSGEVHFITVNIPPALSQRLKSEGMALHPLSVIPGSPADSLATCQVAQQLNASWVVVDGYQFEAEYQQTIKAAGLKLLVLDDFGHASYYYADVVLNQNISANKSFYPHHEPYTQFLLGTNYILLRREFWPYQNYQRHTPEIARKILVTLGGSDPDNVTLKVIQALQSLPAIEARVVVGGSNPHYQILQQTVSTTPQIELQQNVTHMPELMAWADLAISAGGSTCWELALLGLPTVLIVLAENQRLLSEKLAEHNIALNLGWHHQVTLAALQETITNLSRNIRQRQHMTQLSQQLVDGQGNRRVLSYLGI